MSKQNIQHSKLLLHIGETVKLLRKRKSLSQEKLAEMADLHTTTISEIECGKSNLTILSLERIAGALNCSIVLFFPFGQSFDDSSLHEHLKRIMANHDQLKPQEKPIHNNVVKAIADAFEQNDGIK